MFWMREVRVPTRAIFSFFVVLRFLLVESAGRLAKRVAARYVVKRANRPADPVG